MKLSAHTVDVTLIFLMYLINREHDFPFRLITSHATGQDSSQTLTSAWMYPC